MADIGLVAHAILLEVEHRQQRADVRTDIDSEHPFLNNYSISYRVLSVSTVVPLGRAMVAKGFACTPRLSIRITARL
jgi:hypothetical protein